MFGLALTMNLVLAPPKEMNVVTDCEKEAFIELLKILPTEREGFFTPKAIDKVERYTGVLLALTKKDLEKYDLYPFLTLSRGLLDRKEQRAFGVKHFRKIAHPEIKLFWGALLFEEKAISPEIVKFLRAALSSKQESMFLSQILGPSFEDFRKQVKAYPL
jgi:hypothetical protein